MSRVSVIVPVYNAEKYVKACIRSLLMQTYRDLEILVIDDGSTDGSGRILEELAAEDSRIRLFAQENRGVAAARNRGIDAAEGEYLTFVDGDDYVSANYVERLVARVKETKAQMVICGLRFVDEEGRTLKRIVPGEYVRFEREEWTFRISAVCSHLYRRELWETWQVRFLEGERGEDMPISLFFSAVCDKIATLQTDGYCYVQHPSSAMHNFKGLGTYTLPYRALEQTLVKVQQIGLKNSEEFYELFVLRILSTCYFQLARGASADRQRELCNYIVRILNTYFPNCRRNKKAYLFSDTQVPFTQKAAVWLLVRLAGTGLLYPAARIMGK